MTALTKDVMLKIESANIHAEIVSGNSTKMDSILALETPYRKKLARAGMYTAHGKAGPLCMNWREKAFIFASSPVFNARAEKLDRAPETLKFTVR